MGSIIRKLKGGDRRSIGRADEVVTDVLADHSLFEELFYGVLSDDPVIGMRSADAIEKITAKHPEYLEPFRTGLVQQVARSEQQEVRWHVAQMFPRLSLTPEERKEVVYVLIAYLEDTSKIVRIFSMQSLADMAETDSNLRPL